MGSSVFPLRPSLKRRKPIDAAPWSRPRRGLSRGSSRPDPELPLIGVKRPEIRFLHENSKNIPAGSNPSKRHLADRGIVVPSDQERKTGPITAIQIKAIPGRWDRIAARKSSRHGLPVGPIRSNYAKDPITRKRRSETAN